MNLLELKTKLYFQYVQFTLYKFKRQNQWHQHARYTNLCSNP